MTGKIKLEQVAKLDPKLNGSDIEATSEINLKNKTLRFTLTKDSIYGLVNSLTQLLGNQDITIELPLVTYRNQRTNLQFNLLSK